MGSMAHMKQKGSQLQPNNAAFSVGSSASEAMGSCANMRLPWEIQWQQNKATLSVGSNRKYEELSQPPYAWERKLEKGINHLTRKQEVW